MINSSGAHQANPASRTAAPAALITVFNAWPSCWTIVVNGARSAHSYSPARRISSAVPGSSRCASPGGPTVAVSNCSRIRCAIREPSDVATASRIGVINWPPANASPASPIAAASSAAATEPRPAAKAGCARPTARPLAAIASGPSSPSTTTSRTNPANRNRSVLAT